MITKEYLTSVIARDTGFSCALVKRILDATTQNIVELVSQGRKVQLSGFGTFVPQKRAHRMGRNPHTNEPVPIPERVLPVFKPSKDFKESLSNL